MRFETAIALELEPEAALRLEQKVQLVPEPHQGIQIQKSFCVVGMVDEAKVL